MPVDGEGAVDLIAADSTTEAGNRIVTALVFLNPEEYRAMNRLPTAVMSKLDIAPLLVSIKRDHYDDHTLEVWDTLRTAVFGAFEAIDSDVAEAIAAPFLAAPSLVTAPIDDWNEAARIGCCDILDKIDDSMSTTLEEGEWHLPFILPEDRMEAVPAGRKNRMHQDGLLKVLSLLRSGSPPIPGNEPIDMDQAVTVYRTLAEVEHSLSCPHVLTPCTCPQWPAFHPTDKSARVRIVTPDHRGIPHWDAIEFGPG